jgi:hypothetical protein
MDLNRKIVFVGTHHRETGEWRVRYGLDGSPVYLVTLRGTRKLIPDLRAKGENELADRFQKALASAEREIAWQSKTEAEISSEIATLLQAALDED